MLGSYLAFQNDSLPLKKARFTKDWADPRHASRLPSVPI